LFLPIFTKYHYYHSFRFGFNVATTDLWHLKFLRRVNSWSKLRSNGKMDEGSL